MALRRAGPAIIASGLTVIAGMLCLLVADSADISGLGPVAAIGIAVGLLAMITLLPALLVDHRPLGVLAAAAAVRLRTSPPARGPWARIGSGSRGGRGPSGSVTAVLLAVCLARPDRLPVGTLTSAQSYRGTPSAVAGEKVLAAHFPAGAGEPVTVIGKAGAAGPLRARAGQHAGASPRSARRTSGRPGLPAGHADQPAGQPGRVRDGQPGTGRGARGARRRRQGRRRHRGQHRRGALRHPGPEP